jgi:hypothetical protein
LRPPLISSDLFAARGDKWVTEKEQEKYHEEEQWEIRGDRSYRVVTRHCSDNPDLDQYTKAERRDSDSRLRVTKAKPVLNSRSASALSRVNKMMALNRRLRQLGAYS